MVLYKNLEPTSENIQKTYNDDPLGRKEDVDKFATFLKGPYCPASVAVDGEWGSGKTFFVKQVAYRLDKDTPDDSEKCLTVYYDAWENDNDCDPILSIVDCIARAAEEKKQISVAAIMSDILDIAEAGFSNPFFRMIQTYRDKYKERDAKSDFSYNETEPTNKQIANKLKTLYDSIIQEHGGKLIIFIDELDRCKPNFAVSVLERVKHYISLDDRVHIVFSVNRKQLENTVRKHYGEGYDSRNYLSRFFDLVVKIPKAGIQSYIAPYGTDLLYSFNAEIISNVIEYFDIQIREINSFMSALISVYTTVQEEQILPGLSYRHCILADVFPILLAESFTNKKDYEKLICGDGGYIIKSFWRDKLKWDQIKIESKIRAYEGVFQNNGSISCDEAEWFKARILQFLDKPFDV